MKGWSGLLVEPYPHAFGQLLKKHRHAYAFNGGLSTTGATGTLGLEVKHCGDDQDGMVRSQNGQCSNLAAVGTPGAVEVPIAPVHALLDCIGRKTIDFWSLDVEGAESAILKSTSFDKIEVGLLLIEMNKNDENSNTI